MWVDLVDTSSLGANGAALNAAVTKAETGEVTLSSASAQVGAIAPAIEVPALDVVLTSYPSTTSSLTMSGTNFGADVGDVKVYVMPSAHPAISATAVSAGFSATGVTITTAFTDAHVGALKAMVVVQGIKSVVSTVRTVTAVRPFVKNGGMLRISKSSAGNILAIHGSNFGDAAAKLSVALTPSCSNSILEFGSSDSVILLQLADSSGVGEGPLQAVVTRTDLPTGNQNSGDAVQIGFIYATAPSTPSVTASTGSQSSAQRLVTITGSNFGAVKDHSRVFITRHFSGSDDVDDFCKYPITIQQFSSTRIVVSLAPVTDKCVGVIKARVTVNSISSTVQSVATLLPSHPAVTPGTLKVAQSAAGNRVHITGTRFLSSAGIVSVVFHPAVSAKVVHATDALLVVDLQSTALLAVGEISAQVTHSTGGASEMTVVGSIIAPTDQPTINVWTLAVSPPTLLLPITGTDFGTDINQIKVYMMDASGKALNWNMPATVEGTPQDTLLSVSINIQEEFSAALFAKIGVNGRMSDMVQVATVVLAPVVTVSALKIAQSASGNRLEILGKNFGTDAGALNIVVDPVVQANIIRVEDTMLVFDTGATNAAAFNSGTAVKVGVSIGAGVSTATASKAVGSTVAALASAPSITASIAPLSQMVESITIAGSNFGTNPSVVAVYLSATQGFHPIASVDAVKDTEVKIKVSDMSAANFGLLKAVVTVAGVRSALTNIGTVEEFVPFVASASPLEGPVEGNTLVTLSGSNFLTFRQGSFSCYWGSLSTPADYVSDSAITCRTPRLAAGNATLSLGKSVASAGGGAEAKAAIEFKFVSSVFVADSAQHRVVRFNAITGTYIDNFVQPQSGGLKLPWGMAFGPDQNFYVASGATNQILRFHGSTGAFLTPFCDVPSPRGVTFHYGDLYVVSALDQAVYRYNGMTGSLKGTHSEGQSKSGILKLPWAIKFDATNNESYVSSEQTHSIVRFKRPTLSSSAGTMGASIYQSKFDKVWTQDPLRLVTGFDFATDAVYAVSPNTKAIIQYNRATGAREHTWMDEHLNRPIDLFVLGSYVYVCSGDSVRIYHRAFEYEVTGWKLDGMECASMLRNADWKAPVGFK